MARIYRDSYGIPHVRGADVLDLAHGQGRACAHDRAWQLEWLRRRATGTTAELVGAGGEPWDRFAASAQVGETARRAFEGLDEEFRAFVTAYVDGVNAGLAEAEGTAVELAELGATAQPWEPWVPLGAFHAQQVLFGTLGSQLWHRRLREVLGDDAHLLEREDEHSAGSNAWAVGGGRTASGRPMVGGDPHRTFESPGVYHQVRLVCDDPDDRLDVAGFSFCGTPGVQHFAHAGDVAWAITNAMADYQAVDAVGPDHDGPTFAPGLGYRGASETLGDLGFAALLPLLRARTADDVDAAFDHWVEPVNNLVVADVLGTVRYRLAGKVPTRDADGGWTGWLADVHREDAGPDGHVVTANERRGPQSADVGTWFASAHRARRIDELLEGGPDGGGGFAPADFERIHNDTLLGDVETLRPLLPEALRDWDGRMDAESVEAGAFAAWRSALVRRIAEDAAFDGLRAPAPDPLLQPWFDVTTSVGLALPSLVAAGTPFGIDVPALARLAEDDVADAPPTPWGATHRFAPTHVFDTVRHAPLPPEVPDPGLSGDQDCVRCVGSLPGITDAGYRGSVARYVWDLADRAAGGWVVPMGASGRPGDDHHVDQLPVWAEGRLAPILSDWSALTETGR
ncbi:hypothetical protein GCM10023340_39150 [Nocardioides marinquilinus]|uniref:Penicillin acylase family protein n=1 Tax=Nocardioides marinquilinus TaxID=1210400 RepID=A0ABP9PZI8_9ACTN